MLVVPQDSQIGSAWEQSVVKVPRHVRGIQHPKV